MRFARWTFCLAGLYGLIVLTPQYFLEARIGREDPPALTHVEYFYGFVGVALAWQVAFLVIGSDPGRYRPLMIPAVLEKLSFGGAALALFAQGRLAPVVLTFAVIDLFLGVFFLVSFFRCAPRNLTNHDQTPVR